MRQLRALLLRLFGLASGSRYRRELDEELTAHLQFHIDDNIAAGLTPEEAKRQARLALGGVEATCERVGEQRGFPLATWIAQDCRYRCAHSGARPASPQSSSCRWRSAAAPTPRSSRSSTRRWCGRCPCR